MGTALGSPQREVKDRKRFQKERRMESDEGDDVFHRESQPSGQGSDRTILKEILKDPELVFLPSKSKASHKKEKKPSSKTIKQVKLKKDKKKNKSLLESSVLSNDSLESGGEEEDIFDLESIDRTKGKRKRKTADDDDKPKKEKTKRKKKLPWSEFAIPKNCKLIEEEKYNMFVTEYGREGSCDIVGIDIGYTHLALIGIRKVSNSWKITHMAMLNIPKNDKGLIFCQDQMLELFLRDPNFGWLQKASKINIEGQMQVNPPARCLSFGIRGYFHTELFMTKREPDIYFVTPESKYKIAAINCDHCAENPLRTTRMKGEQGRKQRKQLAVEDFECWCKKKELESVAAFIQFGITNGHQVHDFADSFFIALYREFVTIK